MITIDNKPIYIIYTYEGYITIDNKTYRFTIDSGDSYAEIKWDDLMFTSDYSNHVLLENLILEEFEKVMWEDR